MKSSDSSHAPPSWPPAPPEQPPELARAIEMERAFGTQRMQRKPWATWSIVVLCALAYFVQVAFAGSLDVGAHSQADMLAQTGADQGLLSLHGGQLWRLWSCTFLHVSWWHIGGNMWALIAIGPFLEKAMGSARFLVMYALAGLAGSLLSSGLHPTVVSVGASGAIWGVMTAAFGLGVRPGGILPPLTAHNIKKHLVQPLLINVGISMVPGVDYFAHLGGGVVGFLLVVSGFLNLGFAPAWTGVNERGGTRAGWTVLAVVLSLAMVGSLAIALVLAFIVPR